jgi:hypothetical protein
MATKRVVKPVSFNLADPFENGLYEFATKHGPFSKYVKRLIQRDQEGGHGHGHVKKPVVIDEPVRGNPASFI